MLRRSQFRYELPPRLIAKRPLQKRSDSRLLVLRNTEHLDLHFRDIGHILQPNDLLVVNNTRVLKARLEARKTSGGKAELLVERIQSEYEALCQVRVSNRLRAGQCLLMDDSEIRVLKREGQFYLLKFQEPVEHFLDRHGEVPLPPYIARGADQTDCERYQTVYSIVPGAVAAPTAGLHFDEALLTAIRERGIEIVNVTLHVGAGTFQPVRTEDISQHIMHQEHYSVPVETQNKIKEAEGRIVAVGTTVVRTLETWTSTGIAQGETNLFIKPGFEFKIVDALITNFHLPESTLLVMLAAFCGHERILQAYEYAVKKNYRFYSYGDAMYCEKHSV